MPCRRKPGAEQKRNNVPANEVSIYQISPSIPILKNPKYEHSNNSQPPITKTEDRNEDPITGEPGSHPVSTGVGAAGAGTIGVAVGSVVGGPIGGVIGAAVGAIVGGLSGSAVGEAMDPTTDRGFPGDTLAPDETEDVSTFLSNEPLLAPFDANTDNGEVIDAAPTDEDIAARAFLIYEAEGRPEGRSDEHWLRAERELTR